MGMSIAFKITPGALRKLADMLDRASIVAVAETPEG